MEAMKDRIEWIDALKGIGIILVVYGHIHSEQDSVRLFIYLFHMPLFFAISGYLFKQTALSVPFLKQKFRSLLLPYFSFGMIYLVIWAFRNGFNGISTILKGLLIISTSNLPIESGLWFLPALFFCELLVVIIDKYCLHRVLKALVIIALTITGCLWTRFIPYRLPWALDVAFSALGFFYFGRITSSKEFEKKVHGKELLAVGMICAGILLSPICGKINMRAGMWGNAPLAYGVAMIMIVALFIISIRWCDTQSWVKTTLTAIGRHSIVFLCTNHIVIEYSRKIVYFINTDSWLSELLVFCISMVIMHLLSKIFFTTKLGVIIGKRT